MKKKLIFAVFTSITLTVFCCSKDSDSGPNATPDPEPDPDPVPTSEYRIPCVDPLKSSSPYKITYDYWAQGDIIPTDKIIDCHMIPIGSPNAPGFEIWRDPQMLYNGKPSYRFKMIDQSKTRVELQTLFVTQQDLDEAGLTNQDIEDHVATKSLYHFGKGEAKKGETWRYEYGLYLPEGLKDMTGIITQWHGMPDRTTVVTPEKDTIYVPHKEFVDDYLSVMYFNGAIGYNKSDDTVNGYILDAGGNPPMALRVKNGYLYLICRLDRARVTNDRDERIHIYPPNNFPESATSQEGNKTVYGIWSQPLSELPIEQWIDMKIDVKWSKFAEDGSGVLDEGFVKLYMNDELKANWTGYIGNNDEHGTYFKYGLYVPGPNGLEVRVGDFRQTKIE
ncbi:heparin lyase I family protein [Aestuariivivens insulae]|uniref:heparin lyase I family protein n=1 Tax=Aestuariivivens insulae TaxID=1621988 RepID=UPI001F569744|nr:heparin lyase I family protein [Aestuariivivens insulae]